jgi:hypothetical protein
VPTVNGDRRQDVTDSFVPLVGDWITKSGERVVAAADLQKTVANAPAQPPTT